ncbi:BTAD domain-containing putative transcriptional regulator [Plantactinospora solaniradicis]|uniref:BTAD domain-containing putative transcriptional regulator n=2 Tax=Plantactinospora solaniradicis TaxID=1723736 RepID=A0ABW1KG68_9ACTN
MGGPRQRAVLAALAVDAGRPLLADLLIHRVWGQDSPARARQALYVYVARLRAVFATLDADEPVRLLRRARGYLLDIAVDRVDLHRFTELVARSREPGAIDEDRAVLLRQALDLWRGTPLGDLSGDWVEQARRGWQRQYLDAVVGWAEAELRLGRAAPLVGPLTAVLADHPVEESVALVLMRTLRAAGHPTGALDCYTATRKSLVDQLGIEPGAELQRLHQAILRGESDGSDESRPTGGSPGSTARNAQSGTVPAQLPLQVPDLLGRDHELARLDAMVANAGGCAAGVVTGTAGVGKTALAVHWAHRVADRFPDGQLYLNLHGFDEEWASITPADALDDLLTGLGVSPEQRPGGLDARAALYRSHLAGRRMLVVLDNARDSEQVRPLLPGTPGCAVVVTSRNQLTSLVVVEGAHPIALDLLSVRSAHEMLTRRLGPERMAADPQIVDEVIEQCARLPLALAIIAARAVAHPDFSLASTRDELRASRNALDVLDGGDPSTNVRTVLSWSYRTLSEQAARLFRLLGLHPGADIAVPAVASLIGVPVHRARRLVAELIRANMITHHLPGRYLLHDLLHEYAVEMTGSVDSTAERRTARHRLFDHYVHSACSAALLLVSQRLPPVPETALPGVTVEKFADPQAALGWYQAECAVLVATVRDAAAHGFDSHTWRLGWTLRTTLTRRVRWPDSSALQRLALEAARRCVRDGDHSEDRAGQAHLHRGLARVETRQGQHDRAEAHLRTALVISTEMEDPLGVADTYIGFGWRHQRRGEFAESVRYLERSREIYEDIGHRAGQFETYHAIAWAHTRLGNYQEALAYGERALRGYEGLGDDTGEAHVWDTLGACHRRAGDHQQAILCYQRALALFRKNGNSLYEADTLTFLGDACQAIGETEAARRAWQRGLDLLPGLEGPEVTDVQGRLRQRTSA